MAGISDQRAGGGFLGELLSLSVYKRNQGRVTRQVTFLAMATIVAIGVWRLTQFVAAMYGSASFLATSTDRAAGLGDYGVLRFLVPAVLLALGIWVCYRVMNVPRVADFLIAVESEMAKVSWPSGDEVFRSSAVIIFLIFALAAILAGYDLFWWFVLRSVLRIA